MKASAIALLCLVVMRFYAANPAPTADILIRLDDHHGLWGGHTLALDGDGNLFVNKFTPPKGEQRYHLKLSPEQLKEFLASIPDSGINDYREKKRNGVPDEGRPKITLTLPGQEKHIAEKWIRDEDPNFDNLYTALRQWVERATKTTAYSEKK